MLNKQVLNTHPWLWIAEGHTFHTWSQCIIVTRYHKTENKYQFHYDIKMSYWAFCNVILWTWGEQFIWNVGKCLSGCTAAHPRRPESSSTPSGMQASSDKDSVLLGRLLWKAEGQKVTLAKTPPKNKYIPNNLFWMSGKLLFDIFNYDGRKSPQNQTCSNIHIKIHVTCSLMLQQRNSKLKSQVATTIATVQSIQSFWKTKTVNCDTHSQHCGLVISSIHVQPLISPSLLDFITTECHNKLWLYHFLAFQTVTALSDKPKSNREFSKRKMKCTSTVVILCKMGASDSAAAAEPESHFLGCNALSLGEQLQNCWRIRMPACTCRWKQYDPSKWKALLNNSPNATVSHGDQNL